MMMQPYTPHGDSNMFYLLHKRKLLPDATLYPSRGQ